MIDEEELFLIYNSSLIVRLPRSESLTLVREFFLRSGQIWETFEQTKTRTVDLLTKSVFIIVTKVIDFYFIDQ